MGNRGKYGTMDEEEAFLPSSSATSVRGKSKWNHWNKDQQKRRKSKYGSLLQTQRRKKRYMPERGSSL